MHAFARITLGLTLATASAVASAQGAYTFTLLGTYPASQSPGGGPIIPYDWKPMGSNASGQVLISMTLPSAYADSMVIHPDGTRTSLRDGGVGLGITDSGRVYTRLGVAEMNSATPTTVTPYATLADSANPIYANGYNDQGRVVGYHWTSSGNIGVVTGANIGAVQTLGMGVDPRAINTHGQIAGVENGQAFISDPDAGVRRSLGILGDASTSTANAINDSGMVAGTSGSRAFISGPNGGPLLDLSPVTRGISATEALDINNAGQAVGSAYRYWESGSPSRTAFYYDGTQVWDLNTLTGISHTEWWFSKATAIGENGEIFGLANRQGELGGYMFMLTPVPEPSTYLLSALGLLGACAAAHRRRTPPIRS